jgi:hypothetical protein
MTREEKAFLVAAQLEGRLHRKESLVFPSRSIWHVRDGRARQWRRVASVNEALRRLGWRKGDFR